MSKLWQKKYELDKAIEQYTVGEDYVWDMYLAPYDCIASKAHASMLEKIGLISKKEAVLRIDPSSLDTLLHPSLDEKEVLVKLTLKS